jgi:hypothetical protein
MLQTLYYHTIGRERELMDAYYDSENIRIWMLQIAEKNEQIAKLEQQLQYLKMTRNA